MGNVLLKDKVAIVTGAARGLGRSHAVTLASEGADVVVVDICRNIPTVPYPMSSERELEVVADEIRSLGRKSLSIKADIRSSSEIKYMVHRVLEEFRKIDILINNAGIGYEFSYLWNIPEEVWIDLIDVNLNGAFLTCKYVVPHMIARGRGRIINISSISGLRGEKGGAHYSASKHGLIGLTKSLALELLPYNITVNAICPGPVRTSMTQGLTQQLAQSAKRLAELIGLEVSAHMPSTFIDPEDVSKVVVWLASDAAASITGAVIPVDKGYTCR